MPRKQEGVRALADYLAKSEGEPDDLVVALSEGVRVDCDAGPKKHVGLVRST